MKKTQANRNLLTQAIVIPGPAFHHWFWQRCANSSSRRLMMLIGLACLLGSSSLFAQTLDRPSEYAVVNDSRTVVDATAVLAKPKMIASSTSSSSTETSGFPAFTARPSSDSDSSSSEETMPKTKVSSAPLITVCSSLAVVLGLFAALVWVSRKYGSKSIGGTLPKDLVELLGTTSLDGRTKVQMIRVGQRVIIAAQTATGLHPLSEITDPAEVHEVMAMCNGKSKEIFASTLKEIEQEPAGVAFAEPEPRPRRRLFANA